MLLCFLAFKCEHLCEKWTEHVDSLKNGSWKPTNFVVFRHPQLPQDVLAVSKIGIDGVSLQVPAVWQKPDPHDSGLERPVAGGSQLLNGWWCCPGVNIKIGKDVFFLGQ